MPADPTYNDGSLTYGSAVLSFTGFAAIADTTFEWTDSSKRVIQTNQYGEPIKKFAIPELKTGSCTIQLPDSGSVSPGDTFTTDVTGSQVWMVESVTYPYEKESYRKQNITYSERLVTPA